MFKIFIFIFSLSILAKCQGQGPIEEGVYLISSLIDGTVITATHRRNSGQAPFYTEAVNLKRISEKRAKNQRWEFKYNIKPGNPYRISLGEGSNENSDMKYTLFDPTGYRSYEFWTLISNDDNQFVFEGMSPGGKQERCLQYNGSGQNATRTICNGEINQLWSLIKIDS